MKGKQGWYSAKKVHNKVRSQQQDNDNIQDASLQFFIDMILHENMWGCTL